MEVVTLELGGVTVRTVPARGAIVTSLKVGGVELLYLDEATLAAPEVNVRGGIPLLFPFAGKLTGERFVSAGTTMAQHGFGRRRPWATRERQPGLVRLGLSADAQTRAQYPYDFDADYAVRVLPRGLQVELVVHNGGERALPLSPGWHPYFRCPAGEKGAVTADVQGLDTGRFTPEREFDFGLVAPPAGRARFRVPGLGGVRLSFSPAMRHLQFWSLPGRDFICLEPFWGPNDTLNTARRLEVPPGEARDLWLRIELE